MATRWMVSPTVLVQRAIRWDEAVSDHARLRGRWAVALYEFAASV